MTPIQEFTQRIKISLRRDWPLFLLMLLFFIAGIWLGGLLPKTNPDMAKTVEEMITHKFGAMKEQLKNMPFFIWILAIFINNINASIFSFILGTTIIGPAFFVMAQGVIIGLFQKITETSHISVTKFYLSLSPHGIIELSAIFIISGLGVRFGLTLWRSVWRYLTGKENEGLLKNFFVEMKDYLLLFIIMLFTAAIVEVTISPMVLQSKV
jgi:uncharacterized membrane protein SpoIIM required for sporulation